MNKEVREMLKSSAEIIAAEISTATSKKIQKTLKIIYDFGFCDGSLAQLNKQKKALKK